MKNFINNKILPPIMKFVNTKAIIALKDGMLLSIPFIHDRFFILTACFIPNSSSC